MSKVAKLCRRLMIAFTRLRTEIGLPTVCDDKSLAIALDDIQAKLLKRIPTAVSDLKVQDPAYALILCYLDSTTDFFTPYVIIALESARKHALREEPDEASSYIWSPHQAFMPPEHPPEIWFEDAMLGAKCTACYDFLLDRIQNLSEKEVLRPFREMMHRTAAALNRLDWREYLQPTDDFVVIASDWTGYWVQEDARASLLPHQIELLESRELFFNGPAERAMAEFLRKIAELKAEIRSRPLDDQIRYWMSQLRAVINEDSCDLKVLKCDWSVALDQLGEIGPRAVIPLLDLVQDHLDAERGIRDSVRYQALITVREIGYAAPAVHRRLRHILEQSCRMNEGQSVWQMTPGHCAWCLHVLFDGYPEFRTDDFPTSYQNFLAVPMPEDDG